MEEYVKVEDQSSVSKKISIFIPQESVSKKFDEFYDTLKTKVVIHGFRKGHIPRSVLESQFGVQAKSTVSQSLFSERYTKAIADNSIAPVGNPTIIDIDNEKKIIGKFGVDGFSVDVVVEVMPKIDPSGYRGIELVHPKPTDLQKLVDGKIEELREKFAERKSVDRECAIGDLVVVDFAGTIDGKATKGLKDDGFSIKLGAGSTVPGFDDNVIGMKVGESKTFNITFPEKYAGDLGGKVAEFVLKLQRVIEVKLAEVNDELALMAGFDSVVVLRESLQQEAKETTERINRGNLELQIISKLAKETKIEVPDSMVYQEFSRIVADLQSRGTQLNDKIKQNIEASARYNAVRYILTEAIYNKEPTLEITPDELDTFLDKNAKANGKSKDEFVSLLYNAKQMEPFLNQLKCSKVLEFIIANAKQEEVKAIDNKESEVSNG